MQLPNGDRAVLGDKLERYCLNYEHQKGKYKAFLFEKRLGITIANREILEGLYLKLLVKVKLNYIKSINMAIITILPFRFIPMLANL